MEKRGDLDGVRSIFRAIHGNYLPYGTAIETDFELVPVDTGGPRKLNLSAILETDVPADLRDTPWHDKVLGLIQADDLLFPAVSASAPLTQDQVPGTIMKLGVGTRSGSPPGGTTTPTDQTSINNDKIIDEIVGVVNARKLDRLAFHGSTNTKMQTRFEKAVSEGCCGYFSGPGGTGKTHSIVNMVQHIIWSEIWPKPMIFLILPDNPALRRLRVGRSDIALYTHLEVEMMYELASLARGRGDDCILIYDEAQHFLLSDLLRLKMFSQLVFLGDHRQAGDSANLLSLLALSERLGAFIHHPEIVWRFDTARLMNNVSFAGYDSLYYAFGRAPTGPIMPAYSVATCPDDTECVAAYMWAYIRNHRKSCPERKLTVVIGLGAMWSIIRRMLEMDDYPQTDHPIEFVLLQNFQGIDSDIVLFALENYEELKLSPTDVSLMFMTLMGRARQEIVFIARECKTPSGFSLFRYFLNSFCHQDAKRRLHIDTDISDKEAHDVSFLKFKRLGRVSMAMLDDREVGALLPRRADLDSAGIWEVNQIAEFLRTRRWPIFDRLHSKKIVLVENEDSFTGMRESIQAGVGYEGSTE